MRCGARNHNRLAECWIPQVESVQLILRRVIDLELVSHKLSDVWQYRGAQTMRACQQSDSGMLVSRPVLSGGRPL
jgi:hypothetical protein